MEGRKKTGASQNTFRQEGGTGRGGVLKYKLGLECGRSLGRDEKHAGAGRWKKIVSSTTGLKKCLVLYLRFMFLFSDSNLGPVTELLQGYDTFKSISEVNKLDPV